MRFSLAKLIRTAAFCTLAASLACERGAPHAARAEAATDSAPTTTARLTFLHGGHEDSLPVGTTAELVEDRVDVYIDLRGGVDADAARRHLEIDPAGVATEPARWSEHLKKLVLRFERLPPQRDVVISLRAGLSTTEGARLAADHAWRFRRVEATTIDASVSGPSVLRYRLGRYLPAAGVPVDEESVFFVPERRAELELGFSRPMRRSEVEARLAASLREPAQVSVSWADSTRARVSLRFPAPNSSPNHWDTYVVELKGLLDERGLPVPAAPTLTFEVGNRPVFYGWSPGGAARRLADAPPRLLTLGRVRTVGADGALVWHFEEEAGDYWLAAPWLVEPTSGAYRRLGEPQAAFETMSAAWLSGARAAIQQHGRVAIVDSAGEARALSAGDGLDVLQFAVDAAGRIALLVRPVQFAGENPPVGLRVVDAEGALLAEVPHVSDLAFGEDSSPESLEPLWLPDGRLALLRRLGSRWQGEQQLPRHLAIVEPTSGEIRESDVQADRILDGDRAGRLLLDGNRVYESATGVVVRLRVPDGVRLVAFSPDGAWIAGYRTAARAELGVLRRSDSSWRALGQGTLLGWSGTDLYWFGPAQ